MSTRQRDDDAISAGDSEPPENSDGNTVGVHPSKFREMDLSQLAVRFAFGAGVSFLAGVVSTIWGPHLGGVFLAFPAILLASLTIVAKEEGEPIPLR